jgi:cysteine synthase
MTFPNTFNSLFDLIGNTPVIKLNKVIPMNSATVWAKLEYNNPGGSIKDRICLNMINEAENQNLIKPGETTLVEATSGNTGIGLALICLIKGYRLILTMPSDVSSERKQLLKVYGAEVVLTPSEDRMEGALRKAQEITSKIPDSYMLNQFNNIYNPKIHYDTTAREIINQVPGKIDVFIAAVSTGGTISGVGRFMKENIPNIKIYAVEPFECAVISGDKPSKHDIQGIGTGFIPDNLDLNVFDDIIKVKSEDALMYTKSIAKQEGLLVGFSSGAVAYAAFKIASKLGKSKQIVTIFSDSGERYLSNKLYSEY